MEIHCLLFILTLCLASPTRKGIIRHINIHPEINIHPAFPSYQGLYCICTESSTFAYEVAYEFTNVPLSTVSDTVIAMEAC